jgi:glycosyltransferase involved in cell wall biosynthesis
MHVIAGLHPKHGGPSRCVPRLCLALNHGGCDTSIQTLYEGCSSSHASATYYAASRMPVLDRLRYSKDLRSGLLSEAARADIVHSHGLWSIPNVYAGRAASEAVKPLIVSAHGMLAAQALARLPHIKRLFWSMVQGPAYSGVAIWHATSPDEALSIRRFGIKAPIAVIPNGVDVPISVADHLDRPHRRLLFLSRIHPHKGLVALVRAWGALASQRPLWKLVIAGDGDNRHRSELEQLIQSIAAPRISFVGAVDGKEKDRLYAASDLFVLPSKSENFGLVVAEALAAGVPVIVSKQAPWQEVERYGCGWCTDTDSQALAASILRATALSPAERRSMGERGRAWMAHNYGWASVAERMIDVYGWLLGKNDRPEFIV